MKWFVPKIKKKKKRKTFLSDDAKIRFKAATGHIDYWMIYMGENSIGKGNYNGQLISSL